MIRQQKKIDKILSILSKHSDFVTADELSTNLSLSRKTIYRLIQIINEGQKSPVIISERGKGYRLNNEGLLQQRQSHNDSMLVDDRQRGLLEQLLLRAPDSYLVYDLCQQYAVSESTLLKDRQHLNSLLKDYHLKIKNKNRTFFVDGSEFDIRQAISDLIDTFDLIDMDHLNSSDININYKVAQFVLEEIKTVEKNINAHLPYPYDVNIFSHLYILISRLPKSLEKEIKRNQALEKVYQEDELLLEESKRVIADIEQFSGYHVGNEEVGYLYQYLRSLRFQDMVSPDSLLFSDRVLAITQLYFEKINMTKNKQISCESKIFRDLASHISPMLRRLENKIRIKNNMLVQIQENYGDIFEQVEQVSYLISKEYGFPPINSDENGFITLYFARFKELQYRPIKTVVMCTSGIGTSELLRSKLERSFAGDLEIVDIISSRNLLQLKQQVPKVELIITTVALEDCPIKNVLVSALLTVNDKERIRKKIEEIYYES